ncbi:DUF4145 domain-containing protein [Paenibacillus massiliensis]|uniref:DUF4145 domain-containing protein n=1 Tax=Paenibacillus massiliensis TaxID=225917 RepID=UPI00048C6B04|nr:DUF4145 domain-containing protein [Paenibacillus massiliensis]
MESKYYPPVFGQESFHCPYCNVFAKQTWGKVAHDVFRSFSFLEEFNVSRCSHCTQFSLWNNEVLIVPMAISAPMPHTDMPETIISDYSEARSIVSRSPRGAAALLRLALQKLMIELGESGKDINKDIGSLVSKGLPEEIQQALDIVRVVGNESVHPGELDLRDNQEVALQLFELINFIIEERISRKKRISSLFSTLPEGKRKGIEDRDKDRTVTT